MSQTLSLVADVGGTNTRVALAKGERVDEGSIQRYRNADHAGFEDVLRLYLAEVGTPDLDGICVAVAGTVKDGVATVTNHGWTISEGALRDIAGAPLACVINDLQALGHSVGHIPAEKLRPILAGPPALPGAVRLVIGVGTGFNIAPVHDFPGGRIVPASEAGYACLPGRSERDLGLARFVADTDGHPATEEVLSGRGLANIYAFEAQPDPADTDAAGVMALAAEGDPTAQKAVGTFLDLLGVVSGDLALEHMPIGGIYFAGGVSRAMAPYFEGSNFEASFRAKGKLSDLMNSFSISLIEDDYAPLLGTAAHLSRQNAPSPH